MRTIVLVMVRSTAYGSPIGDLVGSMWARMPRNNPAGSGISRQMNHAKCGYIDTFRQSVTAVGRD
jgi:hypothetical protein